jgi:hypothetical protein
MDNKVSEKEIADTTWVGAQAVRVLVDAGYTLESVRSAVVKNNLALLKVKKNGN